MSEYMAMLARIAYAEDHPYAWVITRDRSAELSGEPAEPGTNNNAVGIEGPRNAPDQLLEAARAGKGIRFRLLDEGDIDECCADEPGAVTEGHELYGVVYEGWLVDPLEEWPFGPLDDYGRPNYGCVGIQHFDEASGKWEWV
jgi:hypothetical protein